MLRADMDEMSDFYLYVFDKRRIFRRLKGFRGDKISLFSYLRYYVLKSLLCEWLRKKKAARVPQTNYQDDINYDSDFNDFSSSQDQPDNPGGNPGPAFQRLLEREEFLILRVLYMAHLEISNEDLRLMAKLSKRSVRDTVRIVLAIVQKVQSEESNDRDDQLGKIFATILRYQRRLMEIDEEMKSLVPSYHLERLQRLQEENAEWERKLRWRYRQREKILNHKEPILKKTSYKDISHLLCLPMGTVASQVARARKAFMAATRQEPGKEPCHDELSQ